MPAPGLAGWWKLLDGSGTVAADSSGNGNNGNLIGSPTWIATGPNSGGLSFRGGAFTDSVRIPRSTALEPAIFTISVWFKGLQVQNSRQGVFGKAFNNDNSTPFQSYQIGVQGTGDPTASIFTAGIGIDAFEVNVTGTVLNNSAWQNFVGIYNPTIPAPRQLFYLNGSLIGSSIAIGSINYDTTSAGDLYIATNSSAAAAPKFYQGSITDVRVYNRALDTSEILDIFNGADSCIYGSCGIPGGIVSYSGTASGSVTSDGGGNYVIPSLANGAYTVTPSYEGYAFSPANRSVTVASTNLTAVNFAIASGGADRPITATITMQDSSTVVKSIPTEYSATAYMVQLRNSGGVWDGAAPDSVVPATWWPYHYWKKSLTS